MSTLYKRIGDTLSYHEAHWGQGGIVEHWGIAGESGQTQTHSGNPELDGSENLQRILQPAIDIGYRPIDFEEHVQLGIEYTVRQTGEVWDWQNYDLSEAVKTDLLVPRMDLIIREMFRTAMRMTFPLQFRMKHLLRSTGLGTCSGGPFRHPQVYVFCDVVDYSLAQRVIAKDLEGTEFTDHFRIFHCHEGKAV